MSNIGCFSLLLHVILWSLYIWSVVLIPCLSYCDFQQTFAVCTVFPLNSCLFNESFCLYKTVLFSSHIIVVTFLSLSCTALLFLHKLFGYIFSFNSFSLSPEYVVIPPFFFFLFVFALPSCFFVLKSPVLRGVLIMFLLCYLKMIFPSLIMHIRFSYFNIESCIFFFLIYFREGTIISSKLFNIFILLNSFCQ